jgi:16S rRNA (guanine(966)-N(2))-methyltransferase RsmD
VGELRVIAGVWRGRRLKAGRLTAALPLRPTADRVRTSLFDRLAPTLVGARVLDLFAGTGALGIEALSRGAAGATFIEQAAGALRLIEVNLEALGAGNARVFREEALRGLERLVRAGEEFDLILADPPYGSGLASRVVTLVDQEPLLPVGGLLVVEHNRREDLPAPGGRLEFVDRKRYGDTALTFFRGREDAHGTVSGDV